MSQIERAPSDRLSREPSLRSATPTGKLSPQFAVAIWFFTLVNLAVFLFRAISVLRYGSLFGTSGGESLAVYSIWKGMSGSPVYEWPMAHPFSLSLYNYGFYFVYAGLFRLLDWWGAEMLTYGRML